MSLLSTLAPVGGDLARVDALIRGRLDSDVALVRQVAEYLCTVDANRMGVSLIQSNAAGFGSWLVEPGTGINLHNRGLGFSLVAAEPAVRLLYGDAFEDAAQVLASRKG